MKYLFTVFVVGIIILAFCPWLSADDAMGIVDARALQMQEQYPNLCAMSIHKETIQKVPFGYIEEISYDCTTTDTEYGVLKSNNTVFISFNKGIIGMTPLTVAKSFQGL